MSAQGGDQAEQYLLDYATQLMPHRTTWLVRLVHDVPDLRSCRCSKLIDVPQRTKKARGTCDQLIL